MTFATALAKYALPVALVATFAANANAAGLIPGQCYAKADAEAVLKQEGQMPIIIGSRLTLGAERPANVFFVNKQGYGYNIEGNAPLGQKATELCVRAAFKNTHLNSPTNPEIPSWAKNIKASSNGIDPQKAYANDARIILGAQTYTPKGNNAEALGKAIIVVVGTNGDTSGNVWSVDEQLSPDTSFDMNNTSITNNMVDILTGKTASAGSSSDKPQ